MMRPLFDIATLKDDIEAGALILTSNNRLATKIRQAWGQYQLASEKTSWPQPDVYAIEHWIDECWQRCCDAGAESVSAGVVISPQVEQFLWEQVIDEDRGKPDNLVPASYARLASTTYSIVQRWRIPIERLQSESPLFYQWVNDFRTKLIQNGLITPADRTIAVVKNFQSTPLGAEQPIVMVGFDSIPPLYSALTESASSSVNIAHPCIAEQNPILQVSFHDEQQELEAAAAWAKHHNETDPHCRIGIVIPELARVRPQVDRIFRQELEPDYRLPTQARLAAPFNISAGIPLSDEPLVATALLLLSLNRKQLPLTDLCKLLNSPFWGNEHTAIRAIAEQRLRKLAKQNLKCSEFRYQVHLSEELFAGDESDKGLEPAVSNETDLTNSAPTTGLAAKLEHAAALRREAPNTTSFSHWLTLFQQQLGALGWPGERPVDSIEYQQQQQWLRMCEHYLSLDTLSIDVPLNEALRQLVKLASQTVFQAETDDAPIQILGLLESASLRFDHLWIMGMDDAHWPQAIAPNPLLPIKLQREFQTPRSSPERELALAQHQIAGLKKAAKNTIFSFSEFDTNRLRQASRLIADLELMQPDDLPQINTIDFAASTQLERIPCEFGPPLDLKNETVKGGSSIFRDQATCPFNAFARHRLGAYEPPEPVLGLSNMDRGSLLHDCLENLWRQLGNQQKLLAMPDEELTHLISHVVTTSLLRWTKKRPDLFGQQFTSIEKQRLVKLLQQWLELEKERPSFSVIAFESNVETTFAGLPLRLVIDRIDQLNDGQLMIVDYKTGKASTNSWLGDRPEQPQIPLYVLCSDTPVAAATFAVINVAQQQFVGFSQSPDLLPGIPPPGRKNEPESWDALLDQWQQSLTTLATEFKTAYAPVKFYKPGAGQFQQELEPLNRIAEMPNITTSEEPTP